MLVLHGKDMREFAGLKVSLIICIYRHMNIDFFSNYETHKSFWDFKNTKPLVCHKYMGILILTKVEIKQTDPQYWLTQLPKFNSW